MQGMINKINGNDIDASRGKSQNSDNDNQDDNYKENAEHDDDCNNNADENDDGVTRHRPSCRLEQNGKTRKRNGIFVLIAFSIFKCRQMIL